MILQQVDASREKMLVNKMKKESKEQKQNGSTSPTSISSGIPAYLSEQTKDHIEPFELLDLLYPDTCSEEGLEHALKDMNMSQKEVLLDYSKSFRDFPNNNNNNNHLE